MAKSHISKGFSLVESVLVLGMTILLVTWPSLQLRHYQNQLELAQTVKTVTSEIAYAQRYAVLTGKNVRVINAPLAHQVAFIYPGKGEKDLFTAKSVMIRMGEANKFTIHGGGTTNPRTLSFRQGDQLRLVKMQLEWGKMKFV